MSAAAVGYMIAQTLILLAVAMAIVVSNKKAKHLWIPYSVAVFAVIFVAWLSVRGGGPWGLEVIPILINVGLITWSHRRTTQSRSVTARNSN